MLADSIDLFIQLLEVLRNVSFIKGWLVGTEGCDELLVLRGDDQVNVSEKLNHALLTDPATHISSLVDCVIIKASVESF